MLRLPVYCRKQSLRLRPATAGWIAGHAANNRRRPYRRLDDSGNCQQQQVEASARVAAAGATRPRVPTRYGVNGGAMAGAPATSSPMSLARAGCMLAPIALVLEWSSSRLHIGSPGTRISARPRPIKIELADIYQQDCFGRRIAERSAGDKYATGVAGATLSRPFVRGGWPSQLRPRTARASAPDEGETTALTAGQSPSTPIPRSRAGLAVTLIMRIQQIGLRPEREDRPVGVRAHADANPSGSGVDRLEQRRLPCRPGARPKRLLRLQERAGVSERDLDRLKTVGELSRRRTYRVRPEPVDGYSPAS